MASKAPSKTTRKGDVKRRKVALLAANDQSPQQIASQVKLKERRVQQILNEHPTIEMIEHFRLSVEKQRMDAENAALRTAVGHLDGPKWGDAFDRIMSRVGARERLQVDLVVAQQKQVAAQGGVQVHVSQQGLMAGPVTLDELMAPHRIEEAE